MLVVDNLTVSYGSEKILQNISFSLKAGNMLAVIGPNGSGKTTLLKSILGIIKHYSGSIFFDDIKVQEAIKKHLIGYLPQHHTINDFLPLTVFEVVAQNIKAKKIWFEILSEDDKHNIIDALEKVRLIDKKDELFMNLSGGQQQRVLMALALVNDPKFLFLDEPTSALDLSSINIIYEILDDLRSNHNIGILIISHDINAVVNVADQVALLMHEIKYIGSPKNLPQEAIHDLFGLHLKIMQNDPDCTFCKN